MPFWDILFVTHQRQFYQCFLILWMIYFHFIFLHSNSEAFHIGNGGGVVTVVADAAINRVILCCQNPHNATLNNVYFARKNVLMENSFVRKCFLCSSRLSESHPHLGGVLSELLFNQLLRVLCIVDLHMKERQLW